jgi:phosphoacetylglucosamine mutase
VPEKPLAYGTAGFRGKESTLDRAAFRTGLLVAIRAKLTGLCAVMITASHNGPEDNGVKIVERDGSMLNKDWEEWAEFIVNSEDIHFTLDNINELFIKGLPLGLDIFDY